jgi:hypothetical protein
MVAVADGKARLLVHGETIETLLARDAGIAGRIQREGDA